MVDTYINLVWQQLNEQCAKHGRNYTTNANPEKTERWRIIRQFALKLYNAKVEAKTIPHLISALINDMSKHKRWSIGTINSEPALKFCREWLINHSQDATKEVLETAKWVSSQAQSQGLTDHDILVNRHGNGNFANMTIWWQSGKLPITYLACSLLARSVVHELRATNDATLLPSIAQITQVRAQCGSKDYC